MSRLLNFRVTEEQEAIIRKRAKVAGQTLSDYVRDRALAIESAPERWDAPKVGVVPPQAVEVSPVTQEEAFDKAVRYRQRVNYFKNHEGMTTQRAEAAARSEAA